MRQIPTNEIKKGQKIKTSQLGQLVSGVMMDNARGNTRLIKTHGSELGLYDEMGSVYAHDIQYVEVDGEWIKVLHTEKQLNHKSKLELGGWL